VRFPAPVQTCPGAPPNLLYGRYRVSFPGTKWPGRGVAHLYQLLVASRLKKNHSYNSTPHLGFNGPVEGEFLIFAKIIVKFVTGYRVKLSRKRPGVAQRVPGSLGYQISRHSAHEGGEVVSLTHRPPLPPRNVPGTHFH
jgi:hypothetical protein